jgi:hypothetical protein
VVLRAGVVPLEIGFDAPQSVRDALAAIGRTEDVRLAPGGRRLAIAGFERDLIAIAGIEISVTESGPPEIALTGLDELTSTALSEPHGFDFVDDDTLVVANRGGGIAVFRLPAPGDAGELTTLGEVGSPVEGPGSVAVLSPGPGRHEVLACNNWANTITRHTLDADGAVSNGEVVLHKWLDIPDGLAMSHDGRWLAVSSHHSNAVFLYSTSELHEDADPVGILRGANFPHGIRFGAGDAYLVVADAGAPHVHVFLRDGDGWEGVGYPAATIAVMDDETYLRGRVNPEEGGPKGIEVDPRSGVLVVTSEYVPLAFFDLAAALDRGEASPDGALLRYELERLAQTGSLKATTGVLRAEIESTRESAAAEASALRAQIEHFRAHTDRVTAESDQLSSALTESNARLAAANDQLEHVHDSRSWRMTAPLRGAFDVARRLKRR